MKSKSFAILLLILILQVVLRIPFLHEPMEGDEGVYSYIAQGIIRGEVPYLNTFDHKPPAIYFIYAATFKIFGENVVALRYASLVFSLLTTLGIFLLGRLILNDSAGLFAAFLYGLFSGGPWIEGTSSNTEVFMVLFMVFALYLFYLAIKREDYRLFLAVGILSGFAFMIKQVALINFAALLVAAAVWKQKDKGRKLAWLLVGFLIFPIIFSVYFLLRGGFKEFIEFGFLINFNYIRPIIGALTIKLGRLNFYRVVSLLIEDSLLLLLSLVAVIYICYKDRKPALLVLLFWGLASLLGAFLGGYYFGHYFIPLLPAMAILGGYTLLKWQENALPFKIRIPLLVLLAGLAFFIILNSYKFYLVYNPAEISFARYHSDNLTLAKEAGELINKKTQPSDQILVIGIDPTVYFYAKRRSAIHYVALPYLLPGQLKQAFLEMEKAVKAKNPKYIVLSRPIYEKLYVLIARNYRLIYQKQGRYYNEVAYWGIFERKDASKTFGY